MSKVGKKSPAQLAAFTVKKIKLEAEQASRMVQVEQLSKYIKFGHVGVIDGEQISARLTTLKHEEAAAKADLDALETESNEMMEDAMEHIFGNVFGGIFEAFKEAAEKEQYIPC